MDAILLSLLCAALLSLSIKFLQWLTNYLTLRQRFSVIPGPKPHLFFGNIFQLLSINADDLFNWFAELSLKHKNGMTVTWVFTEPRVWVRKPHHMEVILPNSKLIQKSVAYDLIKIWLGDGLLTSNGEKWHKDRRLITPAFHFGVLSEFADVMAQKAEVLNNCIKNELAKNNNRPINIFSLSVKCTLDTFCITAMGIDDNMQTNEENAYVDAVHEFAKMATERVIRPWLHNEFIYFSTKRGKECQKVLKTLHDFTLKVIQQKQAERLKIKETDFVDEAPKRKAFLDLMLDANESAECPLTTQQLREQVDTFMFAGHDTTGAAISWTLFALGNNLDIQDKVHEEIDQVFNGSDAYITQKDLQQLKYLDRVIKEGLRMYPSAPTISRSLAEDVSLDGILIPKGTILGMQILHMHHDPDIWEDPKKFNPDRFLAENSQGRHPYAFIPFSAGPRNCIGQKFALLELKMVLAAILRKWRVKSVLSMSEAKFAVNIILRPAENTINLHFIPK